MKSFDRLDTGRLSTSGAPPLNVPPVVAKDLTPCLASPVPNPCRPLSSVKEVSGRAFKGRQNKLWYFADFLRPCVPLVLDFPVRGQRAQSNILS